MKFTLVHGGAHGAWCWDRLIPELQALGHAAKAMDLPGHGVRRNERSTLAGYREAIVDVLEPGDVLVGHSLGCPAATVAADAFPDISHIVYLTGPLPVEGKPMAYAGGNDPAASRSSVEDWTRYMTVSDDGTEFTFDDEAARTVFYHDCTPEVAAWACANLTPQQLGVIVDETISIPTFWEADLPRSFIRCTDDRAFPRPLSDMQIERLGVQPLDIASSHSPFLSRPAELAQLLVEATTTKPVAALQPHDQADS